MCEYSAIRNLHIRWWYHWCNELLVCSSDRQLAWCVCANALVRTTAMALCDRCPMSFRLDWLAFCAPWCRASSSVRQSAKVWPISWKKMICLCHPMTMTTRTKHPGAVTKTTTNDDAEEYISVQTLLNSSSLHINN